MRKTHIPKVSAYSKVAVKRRSSRSDRHGRREPEVAYTLELYRSVLSPGHHLVGVPFQM